MHLIAMGPTMQKTDAPDRHQSTTDTSRDRTLTTRDINGLLLMGLSMRLFVALVKHPLAIRLTSAFSAVVLIAVTLLLAVESPYAGLSRIQLLEDRLADESCHLLPFPSAAAPLFAESTS